MIALWLALAIAVAVLAVCLAAPLKIALEAPDEGDLAVLELRHPALSLDVWVPPEVALAWARKERRWPSIYGNVLGVPVRGRPIEAWLAARPKREKRTKETVAPPPAPRSPQERLTIAIERATPWLDAARAERRLVARAAKLDVLELDLDYGTGDPASTALISGALWQLITWLPDHVAIRAQAAWTSVVFGFAGSARVRVYPGWTIAAAIALWIARKRALRALSTTPSAMPKASSWSSHPHN